MSDIEDPDDYYLKASRRSPYERNLKLSRERKLAVGLGHLDNSIGFEWSTDYSWRFRFEFSVYIKRIDGSKSHELNKISSDKPLDEQLRICQNRLLYQVARTAWHTLANHSSDPGRRFRKAVEEAHHRCIICARDLGTEHLLYRSSTCRPACSTILRRSALEVRAPELVTASVAIHCVQANWFSALFAVLGGHLQPPAPLQTQSLIHATILLLAILDRLYNLRNGPVSNVLFINIFRDLKRDFVIERFLAWSATHHRGCLVMSDALKLGASADFFLYNANPHMELSFAQNWLRVNKRSSLLFHGTTLDRLYPIMCDGLRYDAHLRQTGNYYGNGIYLTNDSEVALGYARHTVVQTDMPIEKEIFGRQILVICELLEPQKFLASYQDTVSRKYCEIYVVDKPDMVILRAIMLGRYGMAPPTLPIATLQNAIWEHRP